MESKNNGLVIALVIFVIISIGLGGFICYDKMSSSKKESSGNENTGNSITEKTEDSTTNSDSDVVSSEEKIINCTNVFNQQYGEGTNSLTYYYQNQELKKMEVETIYNFDNEERAKSMSNTSLLQLCDKKKCTTIQKNTLVSKSLTIDFTNSDDLSKFQSYKNISISDLLNNSISDNDITNNQNSVCKEISK